MNIDRLYCKYDITFINCNCYVLLKFLKILEHFLADLYGKNFSCKDCTICRSSVKTIHSPRNVWENCNRKW